MHTESQTYLFNKLSSPETLKSLQSEWAKSLVAPQDGMWEILTAYAAQWEIKAGDQRIGYACIDSENRLLQFFVLPPWMPEGTTILAQLIQQKKIETGIIGTNNPHCLSLAMHLQQSVKIDTYLFTDYIKVPVRERAGVFRKVETEELQKVIDFYHGSMDAPKDWLEGYLGDLLKKGEVFLLENENEILGACEVRKRASDATLVDVGMVVSASHRKKGIGTYLLGKAKEVAYQWDREPICSCEKDNIGSMKSIQNNGFRSIHHMLLMKF